MKTRLVPIVMLAASLLLVPGAPTSSLATAGDPDSTLSQIKSGRTIRVHYRGQGRMSGRLRKAPGGSWSIVNSLGVHVLHAAEVDTIWLRDRAPSRPSLSAGGGGMLLGAAVGSGVSMLGHWLKGAWSWSPDSTGPQIWKGAAYGAGIGAVLGMAMGDPAKHGHWHRIYPAGLDWDDPENDPVMQWKQHRADKDAAESPGSDVEGEDDPPVPESGRVDVRIRPDARGRVMLSATLHF